MYIYYRQVIRKHTFTLQWQPGKRQLKWSWGRKIKTSKVIKEKVETEAEKVQKYVWDNSKEQTKNG